MIRKGFWILLHFRQAFIKTTQSVHYRLPIHPCSFTLQQASKPWKTSLNRIHTINTFTTARGTLHYMIKTWQWIGQTIIMICRNLTLLSLRSPILSFLFSNNNKSSIISAPGAAPSTQEAGIPPASPSWRRHLSTNGSTPQP